MIILIMSYVFYYLTFAWSLFWGGVLLIPPGPREIPSCLRLNFLNGVTSSALSILCLSGYISDTIAISSVLGYFITDLINMILNDFYYKVKSYHTPSSRKIEFCHHILCSIVCIISRKYKNYCQVIINPVVVIVLAEISTPFLIAWRWTNQKNII